MVKATTQSKSIICYKRNNQATRKSSRPCFKKEVKVRTNINHTDILGLQKDRST